MTENALGHKKTFIEKYAKLLVVVAVFFGATSGAFGALISAPSLVIGFVRLSMALPFFALMVFPFKEKREKLKEVDLKTFLICMATGVFLFGHFFTWYIAVKNTNVSGAAVLASFHPLVVLFITIFIYKKKVDYRAIICIFVALAAGAVMVLTDLEAAAQGSLYGKIMAFLAGIFMGIYFAIGGKVREKVDGSVYVLLIFFGCWLSFTVAVLVTGTKVTGYPAMDYVYIACLAILCQIGSHAVFNLCMGHVSALYVSTWETSDPVLSTFVAFLLVRQIPTTVELICCVIVVGALILYNRFEKE